jgi:hypothetical protein
MLGSMGQDGNWAAGLFLAADVHYLAIDHSVSRRTRRQTTAWPRRTAVPVHAVPVASVTERDDKSWEERA